MNTISKSLLVPGIVLSILLSAESTVAEASVHTSMQKHASAIFDELVTVRRDIYQHPEASGEEQRTSGLVARYLRDLGLEVRTGMGGYGVVGVLRGSQPGKAIAWRADMDAVTTHSHEGASHHKRGEKDVRHMCGHDVHTTIGLGIANTLSQHKHTLQGTVYFVFQPAEETLQGAKAMIQDGFFDLVPADELYGLHITPMEVGSVSTKPGLMYSHNRLMRLVFDDAVNETELLKFMDGILASLTRATPGWSLDKLLDADVGIASEATDFQKYFVISEKMTHKKEPGRIVIEFGFVTSETAWLKQAIPQVQEAVVKAGYSKYLKSVSYSREIQEVINSPVLANNAVKTLQAIYGHQSAAAHHGVVPFFNEDFSHFQKRIPGVYFFLGGSNSAKGIVAMPHTPEFSVDERSIEIGVKYFSSLIFERLNAI